MSNYVRQTVSDIIKYEKYSKWQQGDVITITAGTGAGKSHFIKNVLSQFALVNRKRILFLVPRNRLRKQIVNDLRKDKITNIDVYTYQHFEKYYKKYHKQKDIEKYHYIISDEFHYFLTDSKFNDFTDLSLKMILNQKNKVVIFMSASGRFMKNYINKMKGY